jgi:uncharacterized protein (DUF1684 family)
MRFSSAPHSDEFKNFCNTNMFVGRRHRMSDYLDLYDYRCCMSALYRQRAHAFAAGEDAAMILQQFRQQKDALFASHPQSALDEEQRSSFQGLQYFPYNPALRLPATLDLLEDPIEQELVLGARETLTLLTIGHLHFVLDQTPATLSLYWLNLYGGGLFLPFRDITCPQDSYGGGRYLFDTIKGSEPFLVPGEQGKHQMILDFNYAYNPSCAYNSQWICPLAPRENRLLVALPAGEKAYHQKV